MQKIFILLTLVFLASCGQYTSNNLHIHKINENVYALVDTTDQRDEKNLGNNSTHGVIITQRFVILIDSGASYLGAKDIRNTIRTITNKPIKIVINTGGQDHRWLGNDYFKRIGATIISSIAAKEDQIARSEYHLNRLGGLIGDSLRRTKPVYADETFGNTKILHFDNQTLEIHHFGSAHTKGDSMVWLPQEKIMFAGDIVYNDRMLGTGPANNIISWIHVFEKMLEFNPAIIVPGHGNVSNVEKATKDTYEYLVFLRDTMRRLIEDDVNMLEAINIDQQYFSYLKNFDSIARRNAQSAFEQLEFE